MNATETNSELILQPDENHQQILPVGSEIDIQISTARRYPRSLKKFRENVLELVASDYDAAADCRYILPPRDGKRIEGPSARFAESLNHCYQNCRIASRLIAEEEQFITAQGAFLDLENNVAVTFDVKRSIVDKYGNRYKPSLIATTAAAAGSIALRTATLRGIPRPLWWPLYLATIEASRIKPEELEERRKKCIDFFSAQGVSLEVLLTRVGCEKVEEINARKLEELRGYATAITHGESTLEEIFEQAYKPTGSRVRESSVNKKFQEQEMDRSTGEVPESEIPPNVGLFPEK